MNTSPEPLTRDPVALEAMLAAERVENERLRQFIKELQRHRFGRRAERLPIDPLRLGLEEAEQIEAENLAGEEAADPAKRADRGRRCPARSSAGAAMPATSFAAYSAMPAQTTSAKAPATKAGQSAKTSWRAGR